MDAELAEMACEATEEVPWRKVIERGRDLLTPAGAQNGNQIVTDRSSPDEAGGKAASYKCETGMVRGR